MLGDPMVCSILHQNRLRFSSSPWLVLDQCNFLTALALLRVPALGSLSTLYCFYDLPLSSPLSLYSSLTLHWDFPRETDWVLYLCPLTYLASVKYQWRRIPSDCSQRQVFSKLKFLLYQYTVGLSISGMTKDFQSFHGTLKEWLLKKTQQSLK